MRTIINFTISRNKKYLSWYVKSSCKTLTRRCSLQVEETGRLWNIYKTSIITPNTYIFLFGLRMIYLTRKTQWNYLWIMLFNQKVIFSIKKNSVTSSPPEVFCQKDVLRNFAKFTGKHLCQSLFFNKVAGCRPQPATLFKKSL